MTAARFTATEFINHVSVRTLSDLDGSYETVLYANGSDREPLIAFRPVALKEEGLCYSTRVPERVIEAGVSELTILFFGNLSLNMKAGTDFSVRGWTAVLHHEGQMRRSNTVRGERKEGWAENYLN